MYYEQCFFSKTENQVIDGCINNLGLFSKKTLEQFQSEYADIEILHIDDAIKIMDDANRTPATKTTKEKYWYALNVLPPQNWKRFPDGKGDYFQMSEYWSGDITTYYAEYGGEYYTFMDNAWMTPSQVLEKINGINS